ncbi:MAG: hypothetical protein O2807_11740 [bacterium]|nr:hypothetical protein [bacterium]
MAEEEKTEETPEQTPAEAPAEAAATESAPEAEASAPAEEAPAAEAPAEDVGPKLTAREIDKMNVPKLKEAALQYGGRISGVHGMDKNQLIHALKEINGIPLQEPKRESNIDRSAVKKKIRGHRAARDQALQEKNKVGLKRARRKMKSLRRKLVRSA